MYRALALLWLCFVVRGFYYASALPLWEGFDEHSHFAYVQHLVTSHGIPVPGVSRMSSEVDSSLRAYPVSRALQDLAPGAISYERYRALPAAERQRMQAEVSTSKAEDPAAAEIYESQQPPLYYWMMAPVLAVGERWGLPLPSRVFALRAASILLCSLALPLGWGAARRVLGSDAAATGIVAIAVCMPEFLINVARVGNESLAVPAYALLCLGCVALSTDKPAWRTTLLAGFALGCGLLTKSYFLTAIPAVCVIFAIRLRRRAAAHLAVALALAGGLSAWWYAYIYRATGDLTGQIQSVALRHVSLADRIRAALHMDWWRVADTALLSHLWIGGWSFLQLRSWMYHLFYLVFLAGLIGLGVAAVRGRIRALMPLAVFEICFCASLAYHALLGQIGYGRPMTNGWYLYALVFAELILLYAGFSALMPPRHRRWIAPCLAAMFALLDVYGLTFVQIPYYAGITRHAANGRVAALRVDQLPDLAGHLGGAWAAYVLATAGAVWLGFRGGWPVGLQELSDAGPDFMKVRE